MNTSRPAKYFVLFLLLMSFWTNPAAQARKQELPTNAVTGEDRFLKPLSRQTQDDAFTKLGRGFTNIIEGPFELYAQIALMPTSSEVIYTFFAGASKGLGMFVARELVGVYDIVTFPFPVPEGYKPLIEPATTFTDFEFRRSTAQS